ncbi:MAG: UDP-N-acetylmuramoyl-tripeptide--D-alanyl-D-alanine ligase, partial [Clostridia bacterium]|nr:UDP-N-acetylmuramoyl-tripeptide--D-alanyl-D-alanine ligase [Clostridia bacterium]
MRNLTVKDILNQTGGILITGNEKTECICFSKDTRTINDGDCYIGIKGERFDGSKFWCDALDKGASTVIIENVEVTEEEKNKYLGKNIIKVENTLEALYKIAGYKRDLYNIPVIAITGSVGKTSTKDIIANVVSKKYKTLKTIGNNNNNIGMPFTILRLQDEEAIVLEMGMNHLGEISLLSKIAKPTICVITNVGTSHIGNLGSRENILKAKLEIFEGNKDATIIINNDNDLL